MKRSLCAQDSGALLPEAIGHNGLRELDLSLLLEMFSLRLSVLPLLFSCCRHCFRPAALIPPFLLGPGDEVEVPSSEANSFSSSVVLFGDIGKTTTTSGAVDHSAGLFPSNGRQRASENVKRENRASVSS